MNISKVTIAFLILVAGWIICGILTTVGVLVLLYGTLAWGVGYLASGILLGVASSLLAHKIGCPDPNNSPL